MNCGKNMSTNRRILGQQRGIQVQLRNNARKITLLAQKSDE